MLTETYYLQYALPGSQDTCSNENVIFNKVGLSTNYPRGLPFFFQRCFFFGGKLSFSGAKFKYSSLIFFIYLYIGLFSIK